MTSRITPLPVATSQDNNTSRSKDQLNVYSRPRRSKSPLPGQTRQSKSPLPGQTHLQPPVDVATVPAKDIESQFTASENSTAKWIYTKGKIKKRECYKYVYNRDPRLKEKQEKEPHNPICCCGERKNLHRYKDEDSQHWNDNNTELKPTDAFGEVQFIGYGLKLAKYIRVDHNQDMKCMLELMTTQWKLEVPDLIISVTGGAKNFHMKPRLKEVFRRGLMKAAESTGAWIITGGMHAGVMKHVGEAVRDYTVAHGNKSKVVALGIAPWGCVNNRDALISDTVVDVKYPVGCWPSLYKADSKERKSSPIDPNHSHFILVDNGTCNVFGTEIEFRAKLETAVSNYHKTHGRHLDSAKTIPSVCVVLEGGPGTLKTVKSAIESGTPAVIVEGSGRAADILAYAYAHSGEEKVEVQDKLKRTITKTVSVMEDKVWEEVEKQIEQEFGKKNIDKNIHMVRECLKKRDHMTVFRLDGTYSAKDIDMAILQALLKTNQDVVIDQLKLALAWNRIDIAKTEIFTDSVKFQPEELHEVMYEAIMNNKPDFVRLFVANGVDLGEFLTIQRLLQLYNNVPHKELLYQMLRRQKRNRESFTLGDVAQLISFLMGDFYHPLYDRQANYSTTKIQDDSQLAMDTGSQDDLDLLIMKDDKVPNDMAVPLWFAPLKQPAADTHSVMSQYSQYQRDMLGESREAEFTEPARELFIWSVLMNRRDLAMIFWDEGQEMGIAAALLAQKLLQRMMSQSSDTELKQEHEAGAKYFGEIALGVLSECYSLDEKKCHMMLVRNLPLYGDSTIVELAVQADNKTFIGHAACQSLFNRIWSGRMVEDNGELKLWMSIFFTPLIPFIIKFRHDDSFISESKKKQMALKEKEDASFLEREGTMINGGLNNNQQGKFQNAHAKHKKYLSDENPFSRRYPFWKKILHFYNSPIVIFRCNCISIIMYLLLYSMVILTDFSQGIFTIKEWVLITWTITLFMEEIRQVAIEEASKWYLRIGIYISDQWNRLDVITLFLFLVGEVIHAIDNYTCYEVSRIILALTLMTFCFRLLHIFSVHKELGPKMVMIGRMMVDLLYFVVILLVFVGAYGVAIQAIMYPNATLNIALIRSIFEKAYFQIFGELFLEELKGEQMCTTNLTVYDAGTLPRCPTSTSTWLVPIILGGYIMITNVLMLNLLIAMFSYTFNAIQDNTDKHWAFQRYYLTKEFHDRPPLAPPLIFFSHVFLMARYFSRRCCQKCGQVENAFSKDFPESDVKQIVLWENMNSDEYTRTTEAEEAEKIENQVKSTNERVEGIAKQVDDIMENSFLMQSAETAASAPVKLPPALEDRLDFLQQQLDRTSKAVDWIIESLASMGPKKEKPNLKSVQEIRQEARDKRDKDRESKKQTLKDMLQKQLELHQQSRLNSYPTTDKSSPKYRADVPDEKVPWDEDFKDYSPMEFTDSSVITKARRGTEHADIDLMRYQPEDRKKMIYNWNKYDEECKVNRCSYVENSAGQRSQYSIVEGLPLNPCGRTGLCGRGLLYRFGPNHAGDPIVTRWKRDKHDHFIKENGKKVLEFISIQRSDNKEWAIPGGFLDEDKKTVHQCMKIELIQEGLGGNVPTGVDMLNLEKLWTAQVEVYKGYADDPRNTDNAWIETVAVNYHDEDGTLTDGLVLQAGQGTDYVRWQTLSSKEQLYSVHLTILSKLAKMRDAHF